MLKVEEIFQKYKELCTLQKVADYYNLNIETIRQFFIKNDLPYQKRRKYEFDYDFFSKETEKSFYWAGFIAADGGLEKDRNRLKIELAREDRGHLEKFKQDIQSTSPIVDFEQEETRPEFKYSIYYSSNIRISHENMVRDLLKFNVTPNKSKIYNINDYTLNHPLFNHFLRGLIDGDGWIYRENEHSEIGLSGTPKTVKIVFESLKDKLKLESGHLKTREDGLGIIKYCLLNDNKKLVNFLYENSSVFLDRKKQIADEVLDCIPRKIEISKEEIVSLHDEFGSYAEVARQLNVSYSTINRRKTEFDL